jgi:hypothetical protein
LTTRTWITVILTLVAGAFAIHFGFSFPWSRTFTLLATSDWLLLTAACLVNIMSLAAKSTAWFLLLRRLGPLRLGTAQAATFVGAAVNSISVSISGEAARAQLAGRRDHIPFGAAAASLVVTRIVEAIGLIIILALALALSPPWHGARLVGLALGVTAAAFTLGCTLAPWSRLRSGAPRRWHETFMNLATKDRRGTAIAVGFASLNWVGQWLTYHWTIAASHIDVTPAASLTALVMANLTGVLRLTPGNIGVMQGSLILGMRPFDIRAPDALAAGLSLQAVQVLPILAIAAGILGVRGIRRLAARRPEAI